MSPRSPFISYAGRRQIERGTRWILGASLSLNVVLAVVLYLTR